MTDRPILFSAPMVRALLDGRKTQTRRIIKPQPVSPYLENGDWWDETAPGTATPMVLKAYAGDRLWVKEPHAHVGDNGDDHMACPDLTRLVYYRADDVQPELSRWRPSIFMRRQDSRLTLLVTDVRVERLQDISEADTIAEGVERHHSGWMPYSTAFYEADGVTPANYHLDPRESYRSLWNRINGFGAWEANPWIACYSLRVIKQNIDQIEKVAA
ncbi:hypothetical protein [Sinorhizobium meliloti]|uniref:hypothetical protein n=1 Tax=Rhizobium meliloti TaxID=382 RepID=UPI000FDA95F0|nr:hypothetical protein [Sinorhizobium meliloti]RVG26996.1 hypothetical protein CN225_28250 [Sinorhizobium meliloti]